MREIKSIGVESWELRLDTLNNDRFVVYKIVLSDNQSDQWSTFRRYSDFIPFDSQIRRILPNLQTKLPPREKIRPLAGFIGIATGEPSREFIEDRRKRLDFYLKDILLIAGGNKTSLWNHPTILTFLDIPILLPSQARDEPTTCPVPLSLWQSEFARAQKLINEAEATETRAKTASVRGNYLKHLRRQISTAQKAINRLQDSLDFYARVERINDEKLSKLTREFQTLAGEFEGISQRTFLASSILEDSVTAGSSTSTAIKSAVEPLARTPNRSSGLSVTSNTSKRSSLEDHQQRIIQSQDNQLSELSSIIQRHKMLGETINRELEEQDQMLDAIGNKVDSAQSKVNTATRRAKKL